MKIVKYPNKSLSTVSTEVTQFDDDLSNIIKEMLLIMKNANGLGLAANQVGITKRIFLMHVNKEKEPYVFINPILIDNTQNIIEYNEGCLSFPGVYQKMERKETVKLKWQNINGEFISQDFSGLEAICIQHENDHINGITFIDHLSQLKKQFSLKKMIR